MVKVNIDALMSKNLATYTIAVVARAEHGVFQLGSVAEKI
jgi:hypothetical protein